MCLLPNAGSFGMAVSTAMTFGLISLMFLDTSINMAMQPFKMLVGDEVNEKQKGLAYSIQSFLCNAGSLVGYVFPYLLTAIGISIEAPKGVIPDSVIYSFYAGAAILILCVLYTTLKVKEMPPKEYAEYHNLNTNEKESKSNWIHLLKNAPATFWKVGLVQFFSWFAFLFMWTYTPGTVAANCFGVDMDAANATATLNYQKAGDWVGILFAVQAIGSVLWAVVLPMFKNRKLAYSLSLVLGGIGFVMASFIHDQYVMFVPFLLIGCAWAAILAMPFTFVTNALEGYATIMDIERVNKVRMVATSASRDAANKDEFFAMTAELLGRVVPGAQAEIISGEEEAALSFKGAVADLPPEDGPFCVVDLGGGSTEFVVGSHGGPISGSYSAQMGCVRLSERIMRSNPATAEEVTQADAYVAEQLARVRADVPIGSTRTLVGCAGTFTTLSALAQGLETYDSHAIHGSVLRFDALRVLTAQLIRESSEQLSINPVIHPGRADVIAGGAVVVNGIMALLAEEADVHTMTISEKDILDGIIAELAGE